MKIKISVLVLFLIFVSFSDYSSKNPKQDSFNFFYINHSPKKKIKNLFLEYKEISKRYVINKEAEALVISNSSIALTVILPSGNNDLAKMTFFSVAENFSEKAFYYVIKEGFNYFFHTLSNLEGNIYSFVATKSGEKKTIQLKEKKFDTDEYDISFFKRKKAIYLEDEKEYEFLAYGIGKVKKDEIFLIEKDISSADYGKSFLDKNKELYIIESYFIMIDKEKQTNVCVCRKISY